MASSAYIRKYTIATLGIITHKIYYVKNDADLRTRQLAIFARYAGLLVRMDFNFSDARLPLRLFFQIFSATDW